MAGPSAGTLHHEPVLLEAVYHRPARERETPRHLRHVAAAGREQVDQLLALRGAARGALHLEAVAALRDHLLDRAADRRDPDLRALLERGRVLEHVAQLAQVARPGALAELGQRRGRQLEALAPE